MDAAAMTSLSLELIAAWTLVAVLHALWSARSQSQDPAAPEEPVPHHDH